MHGVKRARVPAKQDTSELERKKQEIESKKISAYLLETSELYRISLEKEYSNEALECSTRVLRLNPEFQTGWSTRRRILIGGVLKNAEPSIQQSILEDDLALTFESLLKNAKNYSVWEHRKWVMKIMPDADWSKEMKMVDHSLQKDGRNFHSWDYRRYLVQSINELDSNPSELRTKPLPDVSTNSELIFTTKKIADNFSNFSAWHYRSKLLPKYWEEKGWIEGSDERLKHIDEEFNLVKQAMWSDPDDQSAWLYHRWLVGKGTIPIVRREINGILELLEEEPNSRWCMDSLIFYKRLLIDLLYGYETKEERSTLNVECLRLLEKLEKIDPGRKGRYQDICSKIVTTRM